MLDAIVEVSSKHYDDWSTTDSTLEELGWLLLAKKGEGTLYTIY